MAFTLPFFTRPSPVRTTSAATAERIRSVLQIRQLDSMPAQAARAFQLASDPKATSGDFVSVIEADEVLSARIVRVANSVYFFRGTPANDIEKAVANIGLDELRCLISATMLRSLLQGKHPAREQAWANAVATAICARTFSRLTQISQGTAFLAGLLHDVGKLIMIRRGGEYYDHVLRKVAAEEKDFLAAEEEVFELNHVEVGRWIGETWSFPAAALEAISEHHDAWPDPKHFDLRECRPGVLVKAADTVAHACGIGHPPHFKSFQRRAKEQLPTALELFGIGTAETEDFIKKFEQQFEQEFGLYQTDTK